MQTFVSSMFLSTRSDQSYRLSLSKLALAVSLAGSGELPAATIEVSGGCTLRHAIIAANNDAGSGGCPAGSGADTITLPSATLTYSTPDAMPNPLGITALPSVTSSVTLQGNNSVLLRSYAAGTPDFRLLSVNGGTLDIRDVAIVNGYIQYSGGAIVCSQGSLNLTDTRLRRNTAGYEGGGVAADNCAVTVSGGAAFTDNRSGNGGAIHVRDSTLTLFNSTISDNQASRGGGVFSTLSDVQIEAMQINYNSAFVDGGGIYLNQSNSSAVIDSEFTGNSAGQTGGGVALFNSSATIDLATMSENRADDGGAIALESDSELTLINSELSQNSVRLFGSGGAIYSRSSTLTVSACSITANSGPVGAGVFVRDSTLSASNCLLEDNVADRGGALSVNSSTLSLSGNRIFSNSAFLAGGGVIINNQEQPARLSRNIIRANDSAIYGGAIAVLSSSNVSTSNDRIVDNTANRAAGIEMVNGSTVTLRNTTIQANSAASNAGGLLVENSDLTVLNSTVSGNAANTSAAISATDGARLIIQNSTVSQNSAGFAVGGIQLSNASLSLTHATVFQNIGGFYASGLYRGGTSSSVSLVNSIIAQNAVADCSHAPDMVSQGNWFGDVSCTGFADGDPDLGPLEDNGGSTHTHALAASSGAIGIANNSVCQSSVNRLDQRGFDRVGSCDSGAYEFGASGTSLFVIPLADGKTVVVPL